MGKFQSPLAEWLYDLTLESAQDASLGDAQTFGWYALFNTVDEDGEPLYAIQGCDSQGFVYAMTYDTEDELMREWGKLESWWSVWELDTSCDGLFGIIDTAKHNGLTVDLEAARDHIAECPECQHLGNAREDY